MILNFVDVVGYARRGFWTQNGLDRFGLGKSRSCCDLLSTVQCLRQRYLSEIAQEPLQYQLLIHATTPQGRMEWHHDASMSALRLSPVASGGAWAIARQQRCSVAGSGRRWPKPARLRPCRIRRMWKQHRPRRVRPLGKRTGLHSRAPAVSCTEVDKRRAIEGDTILSFGL